MYILLQPVVALLYIVALYLLTIGILGLVR
jgi:hypothetical protein